MNNQNNIVDAKETGYCTHCKKTKTVLEFIRQRGNKTKKFAICNPCTEKSRQSIQNARSANAENETILTLQQKIAELEATSFLLRSEMFSEYSLEKRTVKKDKETGKKVRAIIEGYPDLKQLNFSNNNLSEPSWKGSGTKDSFGMFIHRKLDTNGY
ncbi:1476_t:CDS:2 [Gigaspora rosea]|nr:1476_t:CDS:2 [Gigaspora rosea]